MYRTIERQSARKLYENTFKELINKIGAARFSYIGKRMYINIPGGMILVEFTGQTSAYAVMSLATITKSGLIDTIQIPFSFLFEETKEGGMEKLITHRILRNENGEFTTIWNVPLSESDIRSLNDTVYDYIKTILKYLNSVHATGRNNQS